ncbi:hypothetical protein HDU87_003111 [Geranomyces variabilis]|uniref:Uncharacterized protein n=1 Tax=Geranomyces variabilis TaxID=109894 RepID=A0AAD5TM18_9FUNG|nr:hypothetical protein HDU87_003111 [Geranomyces variabilis]
MPQQPPELPQLSQLPSVDTATTQLTDSLNRTRFFHGVNVVYKQPPYYPPFTTFNASTSFSPHDIALLASLNVNLIRLGVHWAGAEPTRGQYDSTYFDAIRRIVKACAEERIYVLLEFHQDGFSRRFCGHGMPDWVLEKETRNKSWWQKLVGFPVPLRWRPVKVDEKGMPDEEEAKGLTWYLLYFTYAVADAFGKLYSNYDGLLDSFAAFWARVAEEFKSESNVIGYEIMNEPWPGNHFKNPFLLLPGHGSRTTLHAMSTTVATAIRTAHPTAIVLFEGATWDVRAAFPSVPGGNTMHSVLAYHHYEPPQRAPAETVCERRAADARRLGGVAHFLTEWEMWAGAANEDTTTTTGGGGGDNDGGVEASRAASMYRVVEAADANLVAGWAGWSYKTFAQGRNSADGSLFAVDDDGDNGRVSSRRRRLFYENLWSRTYAYAVAGRVSSMRFERESAGFELRFAVVAGLGSWETEIGLVPRVWYPNGFEVVVLCGGTVMSEDCWRAVDAARDPDAETGGRGGLVMVIVDLPGLQVGTEVVVRISRAVQHGGCGDGKT